MSAVAERRASDQTAAPRGRIDLHRVAKTYGQGRLAKTVMEDCSLTIEPGRLNVVIGPSGCGKSTLLRLIAGFDQPDAGAVTADGSPVRGPASDRLMVFQESALFDWMTVYENVAFALRAAGRGSRDIAPLAKDVLERVGLAAFKEKYPGQLSGGMQRRVELARALINDPAVMLLDEPFRGLDAMTRGLMQEYFLRLYADNPRTVVFVTTEIDEAILIADRLIILSNVPARVRWLVEIDLPRPRTVATLYEDDRANDIKREAIEVLHEEAMKSFRGAFRERASKEAVTAGSK
ncbi:ABC transporter ATP-binding protein [Hansschlegelia zhihuaiae]|uniref:ABC transporter ATP-binding protein n=1 Tax=Hansschlegelia zhihuaiae TaxID=405005 RepID=A0A4V1KJ33_9HYPH|nr:ABC transporter ATP-binding protein [Hansschlegelia zhihuaiae]RXF72792.1 ABC transporter ATP-binding protein [Hansschlegelia zhihuaiae]